MESWGVKARPVARKTTAGGVSDAGEESVADRPV